MKLFITAVIIVINVNLFNVIGVSSLTVEKCPKNLSDEECEAYAARLSKSKNYCHTFDVVAGEIQWTTCGPLFCDGARVTEEDTSLPYPDCCPSCARERRRKAGKNNQNGRTTTKTPPYPVTAPTSYYPTATKTPYPVTTNRPYYPEATKSPYLVTTKKPYYPLPVKTPYYSGPSKVSYYPYYQYPDKTRYTYKTLYPEKTWYPSSSKISYYQPNYKVRYIIGY